MNGLAHSEKPLAPTHDSVNVVYPTSLVPEGESNLSDDVPPPSDLERQGSSVTSPPPIAATAPPSHTYHPLSWNVISLLAFPAVLGVLARLGLQSLATYNGDTVFALAWVQGMGCFVMGLTVGKRESITALYAARSS